MRKTTFCSLAGHLFPARLRRLIATGALCAFAFTASAQEDVEKPDLKFGFIKLTDCAPLVIAKELGFFEDEGLYVTLEAQANWKILLDRVITGELDGAHMLAGQLAGRAGLSQSELVASGLPIRPVLSTGFSRRLSREDRLREATSNLDPHAQQ